MNLNITGKDFELTDSIKSYITEKIGKLEKYFGSDFDAVATLKIEGNNQVAEIRVNIASETFKAATASKDLYASVDKDIEILEGQIRKSKTKRDKQNMVETIRMNNQVNSENAEEDGEIIKTIYYSIKPLTAEDAKLVLEGDAKNKFLPFIDIIKFDFKAYPLEEIKKYIYRTKLFNIKLLADKIETHEDFEFAHINRAMLLEILDTVLGFINERNSKKPSQIALSFAGLSTEINKMLVLKDYTPHFVVEETNYLEKETINSMISS